jgi:hypothetical protein
MSVCMYVCMYVLCMRARARFAARQNQNLLVTTTVEIGNTLNYNLFMITARDWKPNRSDRQL